IRQSDPSRLAPPRDRRPSVRGPRGGSRARGGSVRALGRAAGGGGVEPPTSGVLPIELPANGSTRVPHRPRSARSRATSWTLLPAWVPYRSLIRDRYAPSHLAERTPTR